MKTARRILALARKELLALLRDKRSRIVLVGPPIAQLLVFGYAATFDLNDIALAVYNEDRGAVSREFVARVTGSPHFHEVAVLDNGQQAATLIDNRHALIVLHLDSRFSDDLAAGKTARVQLLIDGRNSNTALLALGYLRSIVTEFNLSWAASHGRSTPPAALNVRPLFNPNLLSRWFIVPGIIGLLMLVVTTMVTALSVAREREAGTFDQLLVTPLTPPQILLGKALPGLLIGLIEGSIILLAAVYWFEIPLRGSFVALYLGMFLFLLSGVGIGLMISSLAVTQQQGILGAFLFLVPAVILSGFATPIANMPPAVQLLTHANPLRYFLIIVRGVFLKGNDAMELTNQYWPLAVIALVTLASAGWLFRHRMA